MVNEEQTPNKILVIQLARLGDIYQTRPVLRAIKRTWPNCELHLVTRAKFSAAAPGPEVVDRHWQFDSRQILEPLIHEIPGIDASVARLEELVQSLRGEKYDRVINLSFSPLSSHLTRAVAPNGIDVRGYTRFDDGFLAIPDDASAYFYAQVGAQAGPQRGNRVHIIDLFAHVAGVTLEECDWSDERVDIGAASSPEVLDAGDDPVVIHIGASDLSKTLSWSKWLQVVKGLLNAYQGNVVLVGSPEEMKIAQAAADVSGPKKPINLVGRTSLSQLVEIIRKAKLVIGGDSAPAQIASLTGTKVLNLSLPSVCFWETGPRSAGSRILLLESEEEIGSDQIVEEAKAILFGLPPKQAQIRVPGLTIPYLETQPQPGGFEWALIEALYMGRPFPEPPHELFMIGLKRLSDVNLIALEQIDLLKRQPQNQTAATILDGADGIMEHIVQMVPEVSPIVRWFKVERIRIGPMPMADLIARTEDAHRRLADVLGVYVNSADQYDVEEERGRDDVVVG
jgi:heptosyltransferase-3